MTKLEEFLKVYSEKYPDEDLVHKALVDGVHIIVDCSDQDAPYFLVLDSDLDNMDYDNIYGLWLEKPEEYLRLKSHWNLYANRPEVYDILRKEEVKAML